MRALVRRHRIASFLAVTYAISWAAWLGLASAHRVIGPGLSPGYLLGLVGPLVGAVAITAIADGRRGLRDLGARMIRVRVGVRFWAIALGVPVAIYAATYVVLAAYSMFLLAPVTLPTWASVGQLDGFPMVNAAALLVLVLVINGFGEETGWRGFLLPELQRRHSPLAAALLVTAAWAPWHVPAFLINETYRHMPVAMIPMFFLGLVAGSIFLTWLYNRGRCSIALVAGFHAMFNLTSASVGARGPIATMESTAIMMLAAALVARAFRGEHAVRT